MAYNPGEIRPIIAQGQTQSTQPGAGIVIYGPEKGNCALVSGLSFSGVGAFSFSLYRGTSDTGAKILIYRHDLDDGDQVIDTTGYMLAGYNSDEKHGFLWLVPHSGSVNYVVDGYEFENRVIQYPVSSGSVVVLTGDGKQKVACCGGSGDYEYDCIDDEVAGESETYQNDKLIGATDLKFVIVDDQVFTLIHGDFTFDSVTGTITFVSIVLSNSTIVIPFNRKL